MEFCIVGKIASVETIAEGSGILELALLRSDMELAIGARKMGIGIVRLLDGTTARAELHWYEAQGIGKVKLKIKEWL